MELIYDSQTERSRQKISSNTIRSINRLEPEVLEEHGVIERARNGGWICKFCGNGEGSSGTGVQPNPKVQGFTSWHCFGICGRSYTNLDILGEHFQLNPTTNFEPLVEKICAEFNISLEFDDLTAPTFKRSRKKKKIKEELVDEQELELIRQDLAVSDEGLKTYFHYLCPKGTWRGLPIELLLKFNVRFIEKWTTPSSRKKTSLPGMGTPRMIIPSGDESYLARLTTERSLYGKKQNSVIEKIHAGTKRLFNPSALTADEPIICVEGYIDALSCIHVGFNAVALGGTSHGYLLVDAVTELEVKPHVVILLDSDESGRRAAKELYDELIGVNCPAVVRFLSDDELSKIDCNQILTEQGEENLYGRLESIINDSIAELAVVAREVEEKRNARLNNDVLNSLFTGNHSDLTFAERIEKFRGDRVRWLIDDEKWLIYSRGYWRRGSEQNSCVAHFGRELAETLDEFAQGERERELAEIFRSAKKINSALTLLKTRESIRIKSSDLDKHTELLNCLNGVVDLSDGKLYPHDSAKLITQQTAAEFQADARSELVEKFFRDIQPDETTRAGLIRWLAYCLNGETSEERFAIWTGASGANGKSTLASTLIEMLGSYAVELPTRALLKANRFVDADRATTALNGIEGRRFAMSEELPLDSELDTALVKNLSGGDRIPLRKNYAEFRVIRPTVKLNLSGNFLPRLENVHDGGILRRMINFAFNVQFGTAERPADRNLKKKLLLPENLTALLALLVRESVAWFKGGGLIISDEMRKATERHLRQNDFIRDFLEDYYVRAEKATVKVKDFLEHLRREYPNETTRFKRADLIELVAKEGVEVKVGAGKVKIFKGIGRKSDSVFDDGVPVDDDDLPFNN